MSSTRPTRGSPSRSSVPTTTDLTGISLIYIPLLLVLRAGCTPRDKSPPDKVHPYSELFETAKTSTTPADHRVETGIHVSYRPQSGVGRVTSFLRTPHKIAHATHKNFTQKYLRSISIGINHRSNQNASGTPVPAFESNRLFHSASK